MKFRMDIGLNEPGIAQGHSLVETLQGMAVLTDKIISDFASPLSLA